jgi:hypothetical protein
MTKCQSLFRFSKCSLFVNLSNPPPLANKHAPLSVHMFMGIKYACCYEPVFK